MLKRALWTLSMPGMLLGALVMGAAPQTATAAPRGAGGFARGGAGGGWGGGYRGGYRGGYYGGHHEGGWGYGLGGFGLGYALGSRGYGYGWGGYPGYYSGYGWGGYPGYYGGSDYGYAAPNYYPDYGTTVTVTPDYGYSSAYSAPVDQFANQAPAQEQNTAMVGVQVPANAQVWFDGVATHQTGTFREFVSPPLQPGREFTYTIRARWMQNGQPVDQTRTVNVAANERRMVDFMAPQANTAQGAAMNSPANVQDQSTFQGGANATVNPPANFNNQFDNGNRAPSNTNVTPAPNTRNTPPASEDFRNSTPSRPFNPNAQQNSGNGVRNNPQP